MRSGWVCDTFQIGTSGKRRVHSGSIPWMGGEDAYAVIMYISSFKWLDKNDPTGNGIHGLFK